MRVLINVPFLSLPGGVANHYKGLRPFFGDSIDYNQVGRRRGIPGVVFFLYDYIKFFFLLLFRRYEVVLLNPSLGRTAILRDSIFFYISKIFGIRTFIFIHGWDPKYEELIDHDSSFFRCKFKRADGFIVLSKAFATKLRSWGIVSPVYTCSTKVDDRLVSGFQPDRKRYSKTLLFLARVESNKGIFLALNAFSSLLNRHPDAKFLVAGSGSSLSSAVEFVTSNRIPNVEFLGEVSSDVLIDTFLRSDVYILPTTHGEGMPTSVLEAMAFALPIVTRPVGGLRDFFEDGQMGYISETLEPEWYADVIDKLFLDTELMRRIGKYNHDYASKRFMASKVAKDLEDILARA